MSIRTICMGLGGRGRGWVADTMKSDAVEFVGMVDPDPQRMSQAAEKLGVPPDQQFSSLDDACEKADPQAAVIVTPNVFHDEHIDDCLDRGMHVMAEKPFVMDRDNGLAIIAKAEAKGLTAMAVQNYRYAPSTMEVRRMIEEKDLGEPTSGLLHFSRMRPIKDMPYAMLYNQGIHHLDTIRYVFGSDAKSVYARSWNPGYHDCDADTSCDAIFDLKNGVVVNYSANYSTRGPNTPYSGIWRIECAEATIHLNPRGENGELWISRDKGDLEQVDCPEPELGSGAQLLADLAKAIQDGVTPPTHAKDNLNSVAMIWAIIESATTGKVAEVNGYA